jgi:hypothetical protein
VRRRRRRSEEEEEEEDDDDDDRLQLSCSVGDLVFSLMERQKASQRQLVDRRKHQKQYDTDK